MAEEVSLSVPLGFICEYGKCPICMDQISSAHMTVCGHNFCEGCIRESLNLKHSCPLCQRETSQAELIKNHALDGFLSRLVVEREKASKAYVSSLFRAQSPEAPATNRLTPVENIFRKHASKSLFDFSRHFKGMESQFIQNCDGIKDDFNALLECLGAKTTAELEMSGGEVVLSKLRISQFGTKEAFGEAECARRTLSEQLLGLSKSHERSKDLLLKSYDTFLEQSLGTPPVLLPVKIAILVPGQHLRRFECTVKATDTSMQLRQQLRRLAKESGDEIVKIESMSRLFIRRPLQRPTGKEKKEYIDDEEGPLGVLLLEQGSEIVLEGKVTFKSQLPQLCFKALLKEGEQRSVTYMQCETCKLKWICEYCAGSCHDGHKVSAFMKNHKPSYACCYCPKGKSKCQLQHVRAHGLKP